MLGRSFTPVRLIRGFARPVASQIATSIDAKETVSKLDRRLY